MTESTVTSRREAREATILALTERMKKVNAEFGALNKAYVPPAPGSPEARAAAVARAVREGGGLGGYEDKVIRIAEVILGSKVPRDEATQELFPGLVLVPVRPVAGHLGEQPLFVRDGRYAWSGAQGGSEGLPRGVENFRMPSEGEVELACDLLHDIATGELEALLRRMPEAYKAKG